MPLTSRNYDDSTSTSAHERPPPVAGIEMGSQDSGRPRSRSESKHMSKRWRTQYAAVVGTVASTAVAFPLESIKTRLQADSPNFKECVRTIFKEEGFKGYWRGVMAPLFSVTVVRTFGFSIYQTAKYDASSKIARYTGREEPLIAVNRPGSKPDWATVACFGYAGGAAGAFSSVISSPFELTKNAMVLAKQIQTNNATGMPDNHPIRGSYVGKDTYRTAQQIVKNCGWTGLYCAFPLHFAREVLGTATYFVAYESIKQWMVAYRGLNSPTSPIAVACAGGLCGMISLTVTYPMDLAKTSYQKRRLELGMPQGLKCPPLGYFTRASYQGLGVAAARSALTNAILFTCFERVKTYINSIEEVD